MILNTSILRGANFNTHWPIVDKMSRNGWISSSHSKHCVGGL